VARYRITHWKQIPSVVEAFDGDEVVRVQLSQRFQDLIDAVAVREGASEAEAYLEGWEQGPDLDRPGGAREVAAEVAAELEAGFQDLIVTRFLPPPA
jgi:cvfA/B/C family virulence factor